MEKHVVIIYPHPDDESFGAAGTITQFRRQGIPVTYLCGTLGEMGRNMGHPPFANRETLPEIRKKELRKACEILDIDLRLLGYRDKTIEFEDRREVALRLKEHLDAIQPTLVITHYPDYAVHPDHNAYGAAAIEAVGMMAPDTRPEVWAQAIANNHVDVLGKPDIVNDIEDVLDTKVKAILAHRSQASGILDLYHSEDGMPVDVKEETKRNLGQESFYIWRYEN